MSEITKPNIKLISEGESFRIKQMKADSGALLPKHRADLESVLMVVEGGCELRLPDANHYLEGGESFVVPAGVTHQIKVEQDFKALHIMPKEIQFEFFNQ